MTGPSVTGSLEKHFATSDDSTSSASHQLEPLSRPALWHLPSPPTPVPYPQTAAAAFDGAAVIRDWQQLLQRHETVGARKSSGGEQAISLHTARLPQSPDAVYSEMRALLPALLHVLDHHIPGSLLAEGVAAVLVRWYRDVLPPTDRSWFFKTLCKEMGVHGDAVDAAIHQWQADMAAGASSHPSRAGFETMDRAAERLATAARPLYRQLFLPISQQHKGMQVLVDMRADLLEVLRQQPAYAAPLRALAEQLRQSLAEWFSVGLLELRRITWEGSSGELLAKVMRYEAVQPMDGWPELQRRLGADRRVFAFFHPALPEEPLVLLHTALLAGPAPATLQDVLLPGEVAAVASQPPQTAAFYSISSTQPGLVSVDLGHFLIKRVAQQLQAEFPSLTTLVTLSPIPTFRTWLEAQLRRHLAQADSTTSSSTTSLPASPSSSSTTGIDSSSAGTTGFSGTAPKIRIQRDRQLPDGTNQPDRIDDTVHCTLSSLLLPSEAAALQEAAAAGILHGAATSTSGSVPDAFREHPLRFFAWLLEHDRWLQFPNQEAVFSRLVTRLAARYLTLERRRNLALDPVANFHLRNGAFVYRVNWRADSSAHRLAQSVGVMVNYSYTMAEVTDNNWAYLVDHVVTLHPQVLAGLMVE